jgi:hypothetical protein
MLSARRVPVYLVVSDGGWRVARFADLLYRVHLIDYESEVLGPYELPEDLGEVAAFIHSIRETIVRRLDERRRAKPPRAATPAGLPQG